MIMNIEVSVIKVRKRKAPKLHNTKEYNRIIDLRYMGQTNLKNLLNAIIAY